MATFPTKRLCFFRLAETHGRVPDDFLTSRKFRKFNRFTLHSYSAGRHERRHIVLTRAET